MEYQSVLEMLISHHPPVHFNRTISLKWGRTHIRLCSRCLGGLLGILTVMVLTWVGATLSPWPGTVLAWLTLAPLPAVLDFHGQMMFRWESNNTRRLLTGICLGASLFMMLKTFATGNWVLACMMPMTLVSYFVWIGLNRRRLVRLLQHITLYATYFQECRLREMRKAMCK